MTDYKELLRDNEDRIEELEDKISSLENEIENIDDLVNDRINRLEKNVGQNEKEEKLKGQFEIKEKYQDLKDWLDKLDTEVAENSIEIDQITEESLEGGSLPEGWGE